MCFDGDFTLTQNKPIKFIEPSILQDLTQDERRALYGYSPLKTNTNGIQTTNNKV